MPKQDLFIPPNDLKPGTRRRRLISGAFFQKSVWFLSLYRTLPSDSQRFSVKVDTKETGICRVCIFIPKNFDQAKSNGILFHIHGGGFVICQPETERRLCEYLCHELGMIVVAPDYWKAPKYPYPFALRQCHSVLSWVASGGLEMVLRDRHVDFPTKLDPTEIYLSGCSAGGNLSAALATMIATAAETSAPEEKQLPLPNNARIHGQALLYPILDFDTSFKIKIDRMTSHDKNIPLALAIWSEKVFLNAYLPNRFLGQDLKDPFASPLFAKDDILKRMPRTIVITGEWDMLAWEGMEYARKLEENGVEVIAKEYEGVGHGFDNIPAKTPKLKKRFKAVTKEAWGLIARELVPIKNECRKEC